jgi:hypothetical protein
MYTQKGKHNDVIATKFSCRRTNAQLYYYNEITVVNLLTNCITRTKVWYSLYRNIIRLEN